MAEDFDFGFTAVDEPEDRGTPAPAQPTVNNDEVLDEIKKLEARLLQIDNSGMVDEHKALVEQDVATKLRDVEDLVLPLLYNLQKNPEHGLTLYAEGNYPRTEKPWGFFEVLLETEFSKVKMLSINSNQMLSMQMHEHRSETWYITQGVATVTVENEILELRPGESIVIDKKEKHRVQNFGDETLEIIEIQTGTYFGEDDIVRFEDKYGRKDFH